MGEIVADLDRTLVWDSVEDLGSGRWKLFGKTKYAAYGYNISDPNGDPRKITEVSVDNYIIVECDTAFSAGETWTLYSPIYLHGTPKAIASKQSNDAQVGQRIYPLVWFLEVSQFDRNYDPLSLIGDTPDMRLFFLDEANYQDWDTAEHYDQVVRPMINLGDMICQYIADSGKFEAIEVAKFTNHAMFGLRFTNPKTADNYSHVKNLVNEYVSGCELRLKVPIRKTCN